MTNHDKSTQDEAVTNSPTLTMIALEATFAGIMAGVLTWLVVAYPDNPRWYDRAMVLGYGLLTGFFLKGLAKTVRRRWAGKPQVSTSPTGYLDRDGDQWYVQPGGLLALNPRDDAPGVALEEVRTDYGPLTPIYG